MVAYPIVPRAEIEIASSSIRLMFVYPYNALSDVPFE